MKKKGFCFTLFAAFSIAAAFNMHSITASAERLYPSGDDISYKQLKVGDVFYDDYEDSEPLIYKVVKTATKKSQDIEVEIAGINPKFDWAAHNRNEFDKNNISICVDTEDLDFKVIGIGDNAFKDNKALYRFSFGHAPIKYVGKSAFEGCSNLHGFYAEDALTTINERAFYNCEHLSELHFDNDTLKSVGADALSNTNPIIRITTYNMSTKHASKIRKLFKKAGAQKIYFKMYEPKKESKKTKIPNESDVMIKLPKGSTFTSDEFTYRVIKPATKKHRGEVEITGFSPLATPSNLKQVDPGSSLDDIGYERYDIVGIADNAFKDNQTITYVMFADCNIRYIGKSAFEGCTQIKDVTFARTKELTKIKSKAFYGCASLKEISIEAGKLSKIGKEAFGNTPQKAKVTVRNMSSKQFSKIKQLIKKAGLSKPRFKEKTYPN
ncbi:leucine-rich repeat protein [Butyrivibrio sp. FC2001]|uniref:leucine-rich repeat protein n=1 Tax=Butyrivibrio sp. FC2001 TaxID=1280671 RepID=UPI0004106A0B|nr:leucine-rich repeat domain-containing protein [Butyrivibrio sp. FC2001]